MTLQQALVAAFRQVLLGGKTAVELDGVIYFFRGLWGLLFEMLDWGLVAKRRRRLRQRPREPLRGEIFGSIPSEKRFKGDKLVQCGSEEEL